MNLIIIWQWLDSQTWNIHLLPETAFNWPTSSTLIYCHQFLTEILHTLVQVLTDKTLNFVTVFVSFGEAQELQNYGQLIKSKPITIVTIIEFIAATSVFSGCLQCYDVTWTYSIAHKTRHLHFSHVTFPVMDAILRTFLLLL